MWFLQALCKTLILSATHLLPAQRQVEHLQEVVQALLSECAKTLPCLLALLLPSDWDRRRREAACLRNHITESCRNNTTACLHALNDETSTCFTSGHSFDTVHNSRTSMREQGGVTPGCGQQDLSHSFNQRIEPAYCMQS